MKLVIPTGVRMNIPSLHPILATSLAQPSFVRSALPVLLAIPTSTSLSEKPSDSDDINNERASLPAETSTAWDPTQTTTTASQISLSKMDRVKQVVTLPRPRAALLMASAMALHFGGYEFVRSGMLALFTSSDVGFSNPGAFPLAMGTVSPFSVLLLMGYGVVLEKQGPRAALRVTTFVSLFVFAATAVLLKFFHGLAASAPTTSIHLVSQAIVALAFVYQNSYAHLLYTQHWSFLSSVMTPEEGSVWFAAIAGLSSLVCTMTGTLVKPLVNSVGLVGMIGCNCLFLFLSLICSDRAYQLSETHGFDPSIDRKQKRAKDNKPSSQQSADDAGKPTSLLGKAKDLFQRVPTLWALFGEVLTFQSLSVILNIAMVTRLKETMPSDTDRAAWAGQFFAAVSGISGLLQFIVIPLCLKRIEPRLVWKVMPIIPLICSLFQSFQGSAPALQILALSFFATKTMDYSIRGVVNEMVYQPLDFDSRYLGKEIIGVFGSRFGKSGVSVILSGLAYVFPNFGIYHLSKLSVVASMGWLSTSWWLSRLVPRKDEAQEAFLEQRRPSQDSPSGDSDGKSTEPTSGDKEKEE